MVAAGDSSWRQWLETWQGTTEIGDESEAVTTSSIALRPSLRGFVSSRLCAAPSPSQVFFAARSSCVAGLFFAAVDFFTREDEYGIDLGFIMGCRLDRLRLGLGLRLDGFRLDGLQVAWVLQVKRTGFFMG
ncbi:hypothetical protein Droror1_Dr00016786 [Drosera rotundifolia]